MLPVRQIRQAGLAHDVPRRGEEVRDLVHRGVFRRDVLRGRRGQFLRAGFGRRDLRPGLRELRLARPEIPIFFHFLLQREAAGEGAYTSGSSSHSVEKAHAQSETQAKQQSNRRTFSENFSLIVVSDLVDPKVAHARGTRGTREGKPPTWRTTAEIMIKCGGEDARRKEQDIGFRLQAAQQAIGAEQRCRVEAKNEFFHLLGVLSFTG